MTGRSLGLYSDLVRLNLGRREPFRVTLMVSEECPLRCATCGIWRRSTPARPDLEDLERFVRVNPELSWINLTGGEIFMRPDAAELFRMIAGAAPRLSILNFPTSGQHPERILAAVESGLAAGLRRVIATVSFDGGAEAHDLLRGQSGAFARAARAFAGLRELAARSGGRLHVHPGLTISAELLDVAVDPLNDLVRDLGLKGAGEIHVNLAHRSDHYYANDRLQALPPEPARAIVNQALRGRTANGRPIAVRSLDILERVYLSFARDYVGTLRPPIPCKALSASVFVDAAMDVYPCTIFARRIAGLGEWGFSLRAMRAGPAWGNARREISRGACPGCWTPCEAYPAILGGLLGPRAKKILRAALAPLREQAGGARPGGNGGAR